MSIEGFADGALGVLTAKDATTFWGPTEEPDMYSRGTDIEDAGRDQSGHVELGLSEDAEQMIEKMFGELGEAGTNPLAWGVLRANGFVLTGTRSSIERLGRSRHPSAKMLAANICAAVPYVAPEKGLWMRLLNVFRRPSRLDPARDKIVVVKAIPGTSFQGSLREASN